MEVTMITDSGAALYYDAANGYTYGDFPIGPYTMKKISDSYQIAGSSAEPVWNGDMNHKYLYSRLDGPAVIHSGIATVAPLKPSGSDEEKSPVSFGNMALDRTVHYIKPITPGNKPLGDAFMMDGGKLSCRFDD